MKKLAAAEADRDAMAESRDRARDERTAWMSRARAARSEPRGGAATAARVPSPSTPEDAPTQRIAPPPERNEPPTEHHEPPTEHHEPPPSERRTIQIGERPGPLNPAPLADSAWPTGARWTPRMIAIVALVAVIVIVVLLLALFALGLHRPGEALVHYGYRTNRSSSSGRPRGASSTSFSRVRNTPRPAAAALAGALGRLGRWGLEGRGRAPRRDLRPAGHHLRCLRTRRRLCRDRPFLLDRVPRILPADEWRGDQARPRPAGARAQHVRRGRRPPRASRSSASGIIPWQLVLTRSHFARSGARHPSSRRRLVPRGPAATWCATPTAAGRSSRTTFVGSTVDDLLEAGAGVCQDFVDLSLILLRRSRGRGSLRVRLPVRRPGGRRNGLG